MRPLPIALTSIVVAVYVLRLDEVAGLYKDDAYYMVLAKALASGEGYALISSAATPILPAFPPGFPMLLAAVFAVVPDYPGNLLWMKMISVLAMVAAAWLTYWYFAGCRTVDRGRSATFAFLTALTPGFVFFATSTVMAECVFTLTLVASAVAIERAARAEDLSRFRQMVVWAALITTAAWLVRSAGFAIVVGGAWFLTSRRGWRAAALYVTVCALSYAPWAIYAETHRPTREQRMEHGGSIAFSYGELLQVRSSGDVTAGSVALGELPRRVGQNLVNVFAHDLGGVIFPAGYRGSAESGLEVFLLSGESGLNAGSMGLGTPVVVISLAATALAVLGGIVMARRRIGVAEYFCVVTIAMVLFVPARTYRYVLPLAPFLVAYFMTGAEALARSFQAKAALPAFRGVAACLVFFLAVEHGQYIWRKFHGQPLPWIEEGREVRAVADHVNRHLPVDMTAVSTNPALLYLLTGRHSVAYVEPIHRWRQWRRENIQYAVALHLVPKPNPSLGYRLVYESPGLGLWILDLATGP